MENGNIEGLKKIGEDDVKMKYGLWVFVHRKDPKKDEKWANLVILEFQVKKRSPKSESMQKTKKEKPYWRISPLVKS